MTTTPPDPTAPSWFGQIWTKLQPLLVRESMVILRSVIKGAEVLLGRLETHSSQLNLSNPSPESSYLLKAQPLLQSLATKWWHLMAWLRGKLPGAWQPKLTETGLTAIFIGVLLILLWPGPTKTPATPPPSRSRPTTIAPPPPQATVLVKPRLTNPPLAPAPATDELEPESIALATPELTPVDQGATTPEIPITEPPTLPETEVTESSPPDLPLPEPVVELPKVPALTPEEVFLADVRTQLLGIPERYHLGLVETLNLAADPKTANFTLSQAWYELSPKQQDGLVQELWQRSAQLDFAPPVITDSSGRVLVRPPVIGEKPVIVHRVASVP